MSGPQEEPGEVFISVDVETAGATPAVYAMLSIGACLVDNPDEGFYAELKPTTDAVNPRALAIGGLSMEQLAATGLDPRDAMALFEEWVANVVPEGSRAVFVGFNAPFDWMFVSDYFERFLGRNPFGHSAVDIKSYYMGMTGVAWARTSMKYLAPKYLGGDGLSHNALDDARDQGRIFAALRAEVAHTTG